MKIREFVAPAIIAAVIVLVSVTALELISMTGCAEAKTPAVAEGAYTTALIRCTSDSDTIAESKACERHVKQQWGRWPYDASAD